MPCMLSCFSVMSVMLDTQPRHKIHAYCGRVTSCTPTVKRAWADVRALLIAGFRLLQAALIQGMCELSGWLFRSKKTPWGTHATGNNLSEACHRYLQAATSWQEEPVSNIEPQRPPRKGRAGRRFDAALRARYLERETREIFGCVA